MSSTVQSEDPYFKEQRRIERRRQRAEDRKKRILNAKTRIMGMDFNALDQQVHEKNERLRREEEEERQYQEEHRRALEIAAEREQEAVIARRQMEQETLEYNRRQIEANRIRRKEEAEAPNPIGDKDCLTSFLTFPGEDLHKAEREKKQREQQRVWAARQILERKRRDDEDRQAELQRQEQEAAAMDYASRAEAEMLRAKQDIQRDTARRNAQQAEYRRNLQKQQHAEDEEAKKREMDLQMNGAFLTEDRQATLRADNPNRYIPYNFKGFSREQKQAIQETQKKQIQEHEERKRCEAEEERRYVEEQRRIQQELMKMEAKLAAYKAQEQAELNANLLRMQEEQRKRREYFKKEVYVNPVSDDFFAQFGTSAR